MTSIYQQQLGAEFARLHPQLQRRFGFPSVDGVCQIGTGVMDEVWRGPWWTLPSTTSVRTSTSPSKPSGGTLPTRP